MKGISKLTEIRVIIHYAPGIGHQTAAITAMKRLRTLGFEGTFDVRYHECEEIEYIHTYNELLNLCKENNITRYITGLKLEYLISGYKTKDDEIDTSVEIKGSEFGKLTITRLPYKTDDYKLHPVELTLCAADDNIQNNLNTYLLKYNTAHYIALQPTDWVRKRFAVSHEKTVYLSANGRLSNIESSIYLPMLNHTETKMLNICHNENFDT